MGRAIFAIGANKEAAFYSGIRVKRIKFWLFVLSGMICGLAGVLWTLRFASARYDSGIGIELFVVTVVLLGGVSIFGGRGTIVGVVLAVAVLGCLQTAMTADLIPAQDQNIVVGGLLLASVIVPNLGDIYRRARARLRDCRSSQARGGRHARRTEVTRGGPPRVAVFGIGLAAYWPQFDGLRRRLEGYQRGIERAARGDGRGGRLGGPRRHARRRPARPATRSPPADLSSSSSTRRRMRRRPRSSPSCRRSTRRSSS